MKPKRVQGVMWRPEIVRQRIRTTQLVRRLIDHAMGAIEMSPTQVRAAEILLKKALPDLSAVEHTEHRNDRPVEEWTDAELSAELSRIRAQLQSIRDGDHALASPPPDTEIH